MDLLSGRRAPGKCSEGRGPDRGPNLRAEIQPGDSRDDGDSADGRRAGNQYYEFDTMRRLGQPLLSVRRESG